MKVKNLQSGPRGLNAKEGPVLLEPGEEREVSLLGAELKVAKATGWFAFDGEDSAEDDDSQGKGSYEVKETSSGWFAVTQDGKPVTKSLRKEDVKDFDAMSDDDKAAFVDLHKAA